jgi:hypothetical protein
MRKAPLAVPLPRIAVQGRKRPLGDAQDFHTNILLDERAMKRRQVRSERHLCVMMLDGNRRSNLIPGNMSAQFHATQ